LDRSFVVYRGIVFNQSQKLKVNVESIELINTALDTNSKRMYLNAPSQDMWNELIVLSLNEDVKGIVIDVLNNDGYCAEIEAYLPHTFTANSKWQDNPCEISLSELQMNALLSLSIK